MDDNMLVQLFKFLFCVTTFQRILKWFTLHVCMYIACLGDWIMRWWFQIRLATYKTVCYEGMIC
jgi:hypothetical protein